LPATATTLTFKTVMPSTAPAASESHDSGYWWIIIGALALTVFGFAGWIAFGPRRRTLGW
jgi:hypothetical protein